jgi:predicted nuclease of predicted toxin-antitoxin system
MKLLLDMGLAPRTAAFLRTLGHDAIHLAEQNLQRLPDADIVVKAAAERRIIVTFDLDFSAIIALQRLAAPSIILFRLEEFKTEQINTMLVELLTLHEAALDAGAIIVVEPDRIRIRSLPIW